MKRRVVIKKLQYVLESTIKKRRKNMKLKKILAQSLAVAMVLSTNHESLSQPIMKIGY